LGTIFIKNTDWTVGLKKEAVILLNMGGPNSIDEVEVFLKNMFKDKNILSVKSDFLRSLIAKMIVFLRGNTAQDAYRQIGGKSPIVGHTEKLVKKLQQKLGSDIYVDFAMRYTYPFACDIVSKIENKNIKNIYLIPLYPHYSTTTVKSSLDDFKECYLMYGGKGVLHEITYFFQNNFYNKAVLESIKEQIQDEISSEFDFVFSAHGLPQKTIQKGDIYEQHVIEHVDILKEILKKEGIKFKNIHLAYQSKVGPMKWLEPSLEEKLKEIKNKKVIIFPLSFTVDNSETDFELDIEYRQMVQNLGYEIYKVCRCPNDSEFFVEALCVMYKKMK